jgi:PAS domain S-box-containing protein
MLYNDAYRRILGTKKHPMAMGASGRTVWPEIWDIIGPMLTGVLEREEATWSDDLLLILERSGYPEECYFTFSYSPIRDESGKVGGVFTAVHETTGKILGERRINTLRDLSTSGSKHKSVDEVRNGVIQAIGRNRADIPFAALYLLNEEGSAADRVGIIPEDARLPTSVAVDDGSGSQPIWPVGEAIRRGEPVVVGNLIQRVGVLPSGAWPYPPNQAVVLPLRNPGQEARPCALLLGVTSGRELDSDYLNFLELVAEHAAIAISDARAFEAERRRAESLAEIDRAKTAFFSNVSHEFRTPLTLMLGPLEHILAKNRDELPQEVIEDVAVAHRNSVRLLKLVNTLLDFSRIESGRTKTNWQETDLAGLTADIASSFRSAVESAGLSYRIDCPPLSAHVSVDPEMWEKIVLNLLSNAFKFTFVGHIEVALREELGNVELTVNDTGTGIPEADLAHIFERFHRVDGARGRTHEGSGIGLALVSELTKLHGGCVAVESKLGVGSAFKVTLPMAPGRRSEVLTESNRTLQARNELASSYVDEALSWLGATTAWPPATVSGLPRASAEARPKILLADDNADLRDYVQRLLSPEYDVESVGNGQAALEAALQGCFDLILSDVMMPCLDGIGLLRKLREDARTVATPVILLTARAGEESSLEGLAEGADDYLIKPFVAAELLARVSSHLRASQVRLKVQNELRDRIEEFAALLSVIPVGIGVAADSNKQEIRVNPALKQILHVESTESDRMLTSTGAVLDSFEVRNPDGSPIDYADLPMRFAARWGETVRGRELEVVLKDGNVIQLLIYAAPLRDEKRRTRGSVGAFVDISARKKAELAVKIERARLNDLLMSAPAIVCVLRGPEHRYELTNPRYLDLIGFERSDNIVGRTVADVLPDMVRQGYIEILDRVYQTGQEFVGSEVSVQFGPRVLFANVVFQPTRDAAGEVDGILVHAVDVTEQVQARAEIEQIARSLSQERDRLRFLAESMPQKIFTALPDGRVDYLNKRWMEFTGLPEDSMKDRGWTELLHPEDRVSSWEAWAHSIETGQPFDREIRIRARDGQYRYHLSRAFPLRNDADEITMWIASHTDIDDSKRVDERIREALEGEVRNRTEELMRSNEQLQGFTYSVAHDLRQQIRGISTNASLLISDVGDRLDDSSVGTLRNLVRNAKQLATLVDDLLAYARLIRQEVQYAPIDLSTMAWEIVEYLRQGGRCGEQVRFSIDPRLQVRGDPSMVRLVLENLIDNACKYSAGTREPLVEIGQEGGRIYVRDNGIGFDMQYAGKLFKPFERLHGTSEYSGTGIGLANVKRIVERHGGNVSGEGHPGKGATFYFDLGSPA